MSTDHCYVWECCLPLCTIIDQGSYNISLVKCALSKAGGWKSVKFCAHYTIIICMYTITYDYNFGILSMRPLRTCWLHDICSMSEDCNIVKVLDSTTWWVWSGGISADTRSPWGVNIWSSMIPPSKWNLLSDFVIDIKSATGLDSLQYAIAVQPLNKGTILRYFVLSNTYTTIDNCTKSLCNVSKHCGVEPTTPPK